VPWVASIVDKNGLPISPYQCRDTQDPDWAIAAPVKFQTIKVAVSFMSKCQSFFEFQSVLEKVCALAYFCWV
jgi:hypothetical protein